MTTLGTDISSYQQGLDLSKLVAEFVIAKATEGTYYTDSCYQGWRKQAAALRRAFVWYHFLSTEPAAAQAAHTAANVGDKTLPGMIDFEPAKTMRPTLAQAVAYWDAAHAEGLHVPLVYLPRWYWQELGSPSLEAFAERGVHLVSSSYPGGTGSPAGLYPGDGAQGWAAYGGLTPALYQYTDQASDGGQLLDYNAFRGTLPQLLALLDPTSGGDVALTEQDAITVWGYKNPAAGDQVDMHQAVNNAASASAASSTKLDQVLAHLAIPAVDPVALATAIDAHMTQTAQPTAETIADTVIAHLAAQFAKG